MAIQTPKVIRTDLDDDEYDDEDDPSRAVKADLEEFEITGLDKFLTRIYPKLAQILDRNAASHVFDTYEVIWEDGAQDETELRYKLGTDYDFADANNATQKTLQKLKEAEKTQGTAGGDDDDFDDFNDYKQEMNSKTKTPTAGGDEKRIEDRFQVGGISWSCNGSSLAVGYGK